MCSSDAQCINDVCSNGLCVSSSEGLSRAKKTYNFYETYKLVVGAVIILTIICVILACCVPITKKNKKAKSTDETDENETNKLTESANKV